MVDKPERRRREIIMKFIEMLKLKLQLFGEGGGAGSGTGTGGADGGTEGAEAAAAEGQSAAPENNAGTKSGKSGNGSRTAAADLSQVKYGIQEAPEEDKAEEAKADQEAAQPQPEVTQRKSFDELMKSDPEYAREMQKRIDNAINKRFAKAKAAEEQSAKLGPALNLLAAKYGVESGDTDALINAINGDSDLIEQQAMDAGMEPDAYREFQRLKAENEALKAAEEERQRQESINNAYQDWMRQAEQLKGLYPSIDIQQEVRNPQFAELLGAGVSVKAAYEVVHMDEISSGLIQRAAQEAKQKTVASIAAKQGRPRENGAAKPQAATIKSNISALTRADFDEIIRRASRGEQIRF